MADFIVMGIILCIVGCAVAYIIKQKKKGVKCIGCPDGCSCSGNCGENSPCSGCQSGK